MHGKESQQNITCLSNKMRDENQSAKKETHSKFKLKSELQRVKSKNESEKKKILHCLFIMTVYIMYT